MRVRISRERANEIGEFFRRHGEDIITAFEIRDPQYKALETLYQTLNDCNSLALLTLLNALISYNLSSTGEEYWWEFARYENFKHYTRDPEKLWDSMRRFLLTSRGNTMNREQKLRRLSRVREEEFHIEFYAMADEYMRDLRKLVDRLSEIMRQSSDDKTIVFTAKMLYYVSKICGIRNPIMEGIRIPVDRRVASVSYTSELLEVLAPGNPIEIIFREKEKALEAWDIVSSISMIPQIRLDSVIWIMGRYVREKDPVQRAVRELEIILGREIKRDIILELAHQMLRRRIE
ncbi:MAG: N-glycosylase/DNA lyase [Sulfolobales archaeon]